MTTLDDHYTALSEALGRVGEQRAALFLATLALDLIAAATVAGGDATQVAAAIERAERVCTE